MTSTSCASTSINIFARQIHFNLKHGPLTDKATWCCVRCWRTEEFTWTYLDLLDITRSNIISLGSLYWFGSLLQLIFLGCILVTFITHVFYSCVDSTFIAYVLNMFSTLLHDYFKWHVLHVYFSVLCIISNDMCSDTCLSHLYFKNSSHLRHVQCIVTHMFTNVFNMNFTASWHNMCLTHVAHLSYVASRSQTRWSRPSLDYGTVW